MRRRQRSLFGAWVPGQADVRVNDWPERERIPMRFETGCPGLGINRAPGATAYGWNITHTPSGTSVMTRIRSKPAAMKALLALCRDIREHCGISWADVSPDDNRTLRCASEVVGPVRNATPMAEPPRRPAKKSKKRLYEHRAPVWR